MEFSQSKTQQRELLRSLEGIKVINRTYKEVCEGFKWKDMKNWWKKETYQKENIQGEYDSTSSKDSECNSKDFGLR